jgi:NAD(P)-dependent dehydrogenase (short-subunit alcohol dehydrogenase family)
MTKPTRQTNGRLANRVAVVTGGGSGTGAAICREFAIEGASVVVADRNLASAEAIRDDLVAEIGDADVIAVRVDITDLAAVRTLVATAIARHGAVDIVVNNAGVRLVKPLLEHSDEDWQQMIDVNLTGHFRCMREFAPGMVQRGWGRIINIASIGGLVGRPDRAAYCAAKAGVLGLTRAAAMDLRHSGVTVNAIAPGSIATPLNADAKNDDNVNWARETMVGRWGEGRDIGRAAVYLASDDASYVNGTTLTVDGGWVGVKARDGEIAR